MKKRQLCIAISICMLIISLIISVGAFSVYAETDLQKQQEENLRKQNEIDKTLKNKKSEIEKLNEEKKKLDEQIANFDYSIETNADKMRLAIESISKFEASIQNMENELADTSKNIEKRKDILRKRALAFQESGGAMSFLDVLLGAKSFRDFLQKASAISTIIESDKSLIKLNESDLQELDNKINEMVDYKEQLSKLKIAYEQSAKELETQKNKKESLMTNVKTQEVQLEDAVLNLSEEKEILTKQAKSIADLIAAKQGEEGVVVPNGEMFLKPAIGTLSSPFGNRSGSEHYGIDITNKSDVPIWAAADGVVTRSYYSSSYGNCIFLTHRFNNQIYTTVYAHMQQRNVKEGQTVYRGQQIGIMGNSGSSFGQHLHFEIYMGEWTAKHENAVNPLNYLTF